MKEINLKLALLCNSKIEEIDAINNWLMLTTNDFEMSRTYQNI